MGRPALRVARDHALLRPTLRTSRAPRPNLPARQCEANTVKKAALKCTESHGQGPDCRGKRHSRKASAGKSCGLKLHLPEKLERDAHSFSFSKVVRHGA